MRHLLITVFILATAFHVWGRYSDMRRTDREWPMYFAVDLLIWRHACDGDTEWWYRTCGYLEPHQGFLYSNAHLTIGKPLTWLPEHTTIVLMFLVNTLCSLYIAWRLLDAPYGFAVASILGLKFAAWGLASGNIGLLAGALALTPRAGVAASVVKPLGYCGVLVHAARYALTGSADPPDAAGRAVLGDDHVRGSLSQALAVYSILAVFAWQFWLSPTSRATILSYFGG